MAFRKFRASDSGNFSLAFALVLPLLLGAVGFAVDIGSMMRAKSLLQNATDAAVLAASRINDKTSSRQQVFQDFLVANVSPNAGLSGIDARLEIDTGINYISTVGTASADVDLYFKYLFGDSRRISVSASAYESRDNLEVVLALDNTGSMGAARMAELRKAATSLVNILETVHAPDVEPKRVVRAALVPFVTAVNIKGEGYKPEWIDNYYDAKLKTNRPYGARYHGANFEQRTLPGLGNIKENWSHIELFEQFAKKTKHDWKGCVEARPYPLNLSDDAPNTAKPDTLFVPYFAPDNPGIAAKSPNTGTGWNNSYLTDDYTNNTKDKDKPKLVARYLDDTTKFYIEPMKNTDSLPRSTGPNYACPTPIMPLTSDFTKLRAEIGKMIHWEGSGTNVSEGLAWSMRVLSPAEPYDQGAPFNAEDTSKFVVVFTDGENTVYGASNQAYNKSDYGAYSFLDQGRVDTNRNTALTKVNTWTLDACNKLKALDVEVFTVLLGADTPANRTLYTQCATTREHYFATNDVSELDTVFKKIASRIAKLYVTQ